MKKTLALLVFLFSASFANAQTTEFKTFFEKYFKAFQTNPANAIRQYADTNYLFVGGDGVWRNLDETIKIFEGVKSYNARNENVQYRLFGKTAIVTGTIFHGGTYQNGTEVSYKSVFTYVFVPTKDGWKQASAQHLDLKP